MATFLSTQEVGLTSLEPTFSSADADGNTFNSGDRTFLHLKNQQNGSAAASVTATIDDPNSVQPTAATSFDPDVEVVVAPDNEKLVGPFRATRFKDDTTGFVSVSYDSVTDLVVAVYRLASP